ncbi:hypothetical protein KWH75_08260 [Morganella morganii]|uniref:hypothetical protein n=1 Tax=Morganella morganii TaxID=582 RepID=UPI0021D2C88D|nr:hypothetical protein [Morganella morganii]MCU6237062.1 hypothetical protein [Morganella morganii]
MGKEPCSTLLAQDKEPVIERIAQLIRRYPSRSAAARAWGVNVNTLNSYFKNQSIPPVPRENILQRIADNEGVTLEWLQEGSDKKPKSPIESMEIPKPTIINGGNDNLNEMLSFLTPEERYKLAEMLARKGVETILQLLFEVAKLSSSELERVIRLAKQVREGVIDGGSENDVTSPTRKQVG